MKKNQLADKLVNNSYSFAILKKGMVTVCSIIFVSILSRYLGPSLKGEYSTYMSWSSILVIIMQMGFFKLYPNYRRRNEEKDCKNIFFSISIYKAIAFGLFILLSSWVLARFGINPIFPVTVLLNMLQGEYLFLTLVDNIKYQNIISIIIYALNVLDILLLYLFAAPSVTYVFVILIIRDLAAIVLCTVTMKYKLVISKTVFEVVKELIGISFFPVIAALLVEINYRVDVIFLNRMVDNYFVGLYASGVTVAEMAWMVPDVFKEILFNKTAKSDNVDEVCFSLRIAITTVLVCLVGLLAVGKPTIGLFFGSEYKDSYSVTLLIFIGVPFMAIFKVLNPLIQARGEWKIYILALLAAAGSNIALNYVLIRIFGMYGAAIASIVSYSISGISLLVYFSRTFRVRYRDCILVHKEDIRKIINFVRR
ncbi:MAG: polysaccharide biosynthesis C-terminal domain-containing protein [Acetatifactor sp.]|nr:polysaccharide biosynthesis C-terminal domain-containing protein [Acetatifactor sp.]